MGQFLDVFAERAKGMDGLQMSELLEAYSGEIDDIRVHIARTRPDVSDEYLLTTLKNMELLSVMVLQSAKWKEATLDMIGLCENTAASDGAVEKIMRISTTTWAGQKKHPLFLKMLRAYVLHRRPGPWFWERWEKVAAKEVNNQGYVKDELLDIYLAKGDIEASEAVALVDRTRLYSMARVYTESWASADVAREWLRLAAIQSDSPVYANKNTGWSYHWGVLNDIYDINPKRALELVDGAMLEALVEARIPLSSLCLARDAALALGEDVVCGVLKKVGREGWNEAMGWVFLEVFAQAGDRLKAQILESAPYEVKKNLYGRLGDMAGRGANTPDGGTKR